MKVYGPQVYVQGTESRLGQVFLNLLVNAAQAIPEGKPHTNTIRVETRMMGPERLCVEIADTGAGIPAETLRHLFTPFFTTRPVGVGTGLGLAICQRIISGYGGDIQVESEVGKGTTFRVILHVAEAPKEPQSVAPEPEVGGMARGTVLVVDDEELVGNAVRRVLLSEHDVVAVRSVDAALELIRGGARFEVILSDLMMPVKNGIDLSRALRAQHPGQEQRIVFITGGAFTPSARAFLDSVPNRRLDKPFLAEQLRALVNGQVSLQAGS